MSLQDWLCKIGLHKWGKATFHHNFMSNFKDWKKTCKNCGKRKTWVQIYRGK